MLRRLFATTYGSGRGFEEVDVWAAFAAETDDALAQQVRALVTGGFDPELTPLLLAGAGLAITTALFILHLKKRGVLSG